MEKLREYRREKGVTQIRAAKDLGLTTAAYRNYEYGNREPNIATLKKMAVYYGVTVDELIN